MFLGTSGEGILGVSEGDYHDENSRGSDVLRMDCLDVCLYDVYREGHLCGSVGRTFSFCQSCTSGFMGVIHAPRSLAEMAGWDSGITCSGVGHHDFSGRSAGGHDAIQVVVRAADPVSCCLGRGRAQGFAIRVWPSV